MAEAWGKKVAWELVKKKERKGQEGRHAHPQVPSQPHRRHRTPSDLRNGPVSILEDVTRVHGAELCGVVAWEEFFLNRYVGGQDFRSYVRFRV